MSSRTFEGLAHGPRNVTIRTPLSEAEHRTVAELWAQAEATRCLTFATGSLRGEPDLRTVARLYPGLEELHLGRAAGLEALIGIEAWEASLRFVSLYDQKRRLSLKPLAACSRIERLYIDTTYTDLGALSQMPRLVQLYARSIRHLSIEHLLGLPNLQAVLLEFGGIDFIQRLEALPFLRVLELRGVAGGAAIAGIRLPSSMEELRLLEMDGLYELPDLVHTKLVRLHLSSLKDLRSLGDAGACGYLRDVFLDRVPSLPPEEVFAISRAKSIRYFTPGRLTTEQSLVAHQLNLPSIPDLGIHPIVRSARARDLL